MTLFSPMFVLACVAAALAPAGASAQAQPLSGPRQSPKTAPALKPEAPVVTLRGLCNKLQANAACETVVTRADLDRFSSATAPGASDSARSQLAVQYATILTFSKLAEQQGLENNPEVAKALQEQLKLERMRFLASAFVQSLQKRTGGVLPAEVDRYYEINQSHYQIAEVLRVALPISAPTESGQPLDRSAVKAEMENLRTRALAGEDLAQLQHEAFAHLHIQATPPALAPLTLRAQEVQGPETAAFMLKPGEISPVLDLPAAFAILKLESKDQVPLNAVRPEIEASLSERNMQEVLHRLAKNMNVQFDLQYLGLVSQPDIFTVTATSPAARRAVIRRRANPVVSHWASR